MMPAIPANWMPEVIRVASQASDQRGPRRRRRRRNEGRVRAQPSDTAVRLRIGAADRQRQRGEPAAGSRRNAPRANRAAPGPGRHARGRLLWRPSRKASCWRSVGGIVGLLVAVAGARLLLALAFHSAHFLPISPMPSFVVLGFCFLLALVTGVIFGTVPAWFATRTDPAEALHGAGRRTSDRSSFTRQALLIVQATLSVVLVAGATHAGAEP